MVFALVIVPIPNRTIICECREYLCRMQNFGYFLLLIPMRQYIAVYTNISSLDTYSSGPDYFQVGMHGFYTTLVKSVQYF